MQIVNAKPFHGPSMNSRASHARSRILSMTAEAVGRGATYSLRRSVILCVTLGVALAVLASPQPASAWRHGRAFVGPGAYVGSAWASSSFAVFPGVRPLPGYRFAFPPGAPLSYSDPSSGTTYCLSQPTGFYYECGYSPASSYPVGPVPPMPPGFAPSPAEYPPPQASGVLLFRLPEGAEAAVDDVPIHLSEGSAITAVAPGRHRVVLRVSGKDTEHTVSVGPHRILTVTPTSIVATEP